MLCVGTALLRILSSCTHNNRCRSPCRRPPPLRAFALAMYSKSDLGVGQRGHPLCKQGELRRVTWDRCKPAVGAGWRQRAAIGMATAARCATRAETREEPTLGWGRHANTMLARRREYTKPSATVPPVLVRRRSTLHSERPRRSKRNEWLRLHRNGCGGLHCTTCFLTRGTRVGTVAGTVVGMWWVDTHLSVSCHASMLVCRIDWRCSVDALPEIRRCRSVSFLV